MFSSYDCFVQIQRKLNDSYHPNIFQSQKISHRPVFSVSVKKIHSRDNACSMETSEEEMFTSYKKLDRSEEAISSRNETNVSIDHTLYEQSQKENQRKR